MEVLVLEAEVGREDPCLEVPYLEDAYREEGSWDQMEGVRTKVVGVSSALEEAGHAYEAEGGHVSSGAEPPN